MKMSKLVTFFICTAFAAACSDANDNGNSNKHTSAQLSRNEVIWMKTNEGGEFAQLLTQGDAKHTFNAVITDGAEFCSFKLTEKTASTSGNLGKMGVFLYLDANYDSNDRKVTIKVAFSNATPDVTLELTQRAYSSSAKYDQHDWAELPHYKDNSAYIYKTYYTTLSSGSETVRNFSVCYDSQRRVAHWVAYPVHTCYTTPSLSRVNKWAYDDAVTEPTSDAAGYRIVEYRVTQPEIPQTMQQNIIQTYGSGHQRGHMLPSASRYSNWNTNAQTFYATNMMPQNGDFNGGEWANLEGIVRKNGGSVSRDTLYVVTGTYFGDSYTITDKPANNEKTGKTIAVPSHAYKVLLKAKNRIPEGKTIADLNASELKAIGFWFPNPSPRAAAPTTVKEAVCSVAEIEARTGFSYFRMLRPEVAEEVKRQCNPSSWSGL